MRTTICFFSGTGNSYAIAKNIAGQLGADCVSIASVIKQPRISLSTDVLGIVFPVYNHGAPYIIKRFVNQMGSLKNKYVFGVCTYANGPCLTHEYLQNYIAEKEGTLFGGFAVKMPYNYIAPILTVKGFFQSFTLRETPEEKQQEMFADAEKKILEICGYVKQRKSGTVEIASAGIEHLVNRLNLKETLQKAVWLKVAGYRGKTQLSYIESIQLMDSGFHSDENCIGCGTCERICPVDNIKLVCGKLVWQHTCEQCFACLQWCPQAAIQYGANTAGKKRYHHPDITAADMVKINNFKGEKNESK